jgi:hypothetical protein
MNRGVSAPVGRLSWDQAHRLEVTLRARASRLSAGGARGQCPGCGRPVAPEDNQFRLAGLLVHPECLREESLI